MEENSVSTPPPTFTAATAGSHERKRETTSIMSRIKENCLYFTASIKEAFGYVKAFFIGQGKKMTAKNEKEATEADLQTAKMQVEAADAAEETKKALHND